VPRTLIIFDLEGTLVDCVNETLSCWQETFRSFGFGFSIAQLHPHSGRDPKDMIRALLPRGDADRLASALMEAQGRRYREHYLPRVKAFPKVRALFEQLRKEGRSIAIATSCAKDELRHYLALIGASELIDAVASGDDVKHQKPHPDLIRLALRRAGAPAEALMVGDTPYDAEAGRAAGVAAAGVLRGGFSRRTLTDAGCIAVYEAAAETLEKTRALPVRPVQSRRSETRSKQSAARRRVRRRTDAATSAGRRTRARRAR
jgi:HAD superfamily hydrolase (TIGR01549 family)